MVVFAFRRGKEIRCPFYEPDRKFTVPFCDNLISGIPSCVLAEFYPDLDPFSFKSIEEYEEFSNRFEVCSHFVRGDVYHFPHSKFLKGNCFFGGLCVYPTVKGFSNCSFDCFLCEGSEAT